ncbi:hypothetical protein Pcac1_g28830 [Phytophthora cactorum]|nr:hypothetical protein Pcac1_g28830 [Phytophthora cactorum]
MPSPWTPPRLTTARINKFDEPTSTRGKFKMHMVLEERDLWEVVCGETKLEHCTTALDQAAFKRKSRKALAIICLAMEDSQLPFVRSASGPHDAWSRLEGHFEKRSLATSSFFRRRFFTTMMDEGDDVLEHIDKVKTLAEQLGRGGRSGQRGRLGDHASGKFERVVPVPHHSVGVESRLVDVGTRDVSAAA